MQCIKQSYVNQAIDEIFAVFSLPTTGCHYQTLYLLKSSFVLYSFLYVQLIRNQSTGKGRFELRGHLCLSNPVELIFERFICIYMFQISAKRYLTLFLDLQLYFLLKTLHLSLIPFLQIVSFHHHLLF